MTLGLGCRRADARSPQGPRTFRRREIVGRNQRQPRGARKAVGCCAREQDVRRLFHHDARRDHRVSYAPRPRHRARPAGGAIHHRRVELMFARSIENGAAPGVE